MTYREQCGMSEVKVDPACLADGVTELPCPECGEVVHVAGTPDARYAIHMAPYSDGWGFAGPADWVCEECGHVCGPKQEACWSCLTPRPDVEPSLSIGDTVKALAESRFWSGCCQEGDGVVTHDAADPEHGVKASLRLLDDAQ